MEQPMLYVENKGEKSTSKPKKQTQQHLAVDIESENPSDPSRIPDCSDSMHISMAWSLEQPALDEEALSCKAAQDDLKALSTTFDDIKVKMGNTITSIALSTRGTGVRRGFLGL